MKQELQSPDLLKKKPHHRKLIKMKKQRVLSQIKGQDKNLPKPLNEVEIGTTFQEKNSE